MSDELSRTFLGSGQGGFGVSLVMGAVLTQWDYPTSYGNIVTDGAYTFTNCPVLNPSTLQPGRVLLLFTPGGPVILGNTYQGGTVPVIPGGGGGGGTGGGGGGTGDGTAATAFGWGTPLTASDEFTYTGSPNASKWDVLTGAGYNGNGTRSAAQVTVNGSTMVISGAAGSATTGAVLHNVWQRYGRWEARVRSSVTGTGTGDYRVGLLLWPADGVVNVPPTSMQDVDTSDTPEVAWPHQTGLPGERVDVSVATSALSARYADLTRQAVATWDRSSVVHPVAVNACPTGSNCCSMITKSIGSDPDTDAETDSNDSGGVRRSSTITLYTDWLDNETDNGALATITHELGHVFGLVHRNNPADLMNATTDDTTNPIPDLVDYTNIASFYGSGASGQYFFLEAAQAGQADAKITMHYPRLSGPDISESVTVAGLDLTQWHNFAIEWSSAQIIVWVDGVEAARKSGGSGGALRALQATRGPMRLAMQLDAMAATGMRAAQMEIEWARAYPLT